MLQRLLEKKIKVCLTGYAKHLFIVVMKQVLLPILDESEEKGCGKTLSY